MGVDWIGLDRLLTKLRLGALAPPTPHLPVRACVSSRFPPSSLVFRYLYMYSAVSSLFAHVKSVNTTFRPQTINGPPPASPRVPLAAPPTLSGVTSTLPSSFRLQWQLHHPSHPSASSFAATVLGRQVTMQERARAPTRPTSLACAAPLQKMPTCQMAPGSLRSFTTIVASAPFFQPLSDARSPVSTNTVSYPLPSFTHTTLHHHHHQVPSASASTNTFSPPTTSSSAITPLGMSYSSLGSPVAASPVAVSPQ